MTLTNEALPESVQRVSQALLAAGHMHTPLMLEKACRTSQEAAEVLNVALGQIAKSVIFAHSEGKAVLVVAAGDKRVDEAKVTALVGKIGRADASFVRQQTGFPIGGVSPVAHANAPVVLLDASLKRFDIVWAAAGHPNSVFQLSPDDLQRLTGAKFTEVAQ
jgi:prolyl-tRNA editing enzyme YbaK/EbsC (Cys-tRNA(Pro) deacylase)